MTAFYAAFFETTPTGYSVFFPDLPGCISSGRTTDEAAGNAHAALAIHVEGLIESGEPVPPRTLLDKIVAPIHFALDTAHQILLVGVEVPGRSIRVNITIDEGLLAAIDRVARNRSRFIADAARAALQTRRAL